MKKPIASRKFEFQKGIGLALKFLNTVTDRKNEFGFRTYTTMVIKEERNGDGGTARPKGRVEEKNKGQSEFSLSYEGRGVNCIFLTHT